MSTESTLDLVAPEFECIDSNRKAAAITLAESQLSESVLGTNYVLGTALLAAHILKIGERRGSSGPVTSATEGGLSVSYGQSALTPSAWAFTAYGTELQALIRRSDLHARVAGE